MKLADGEAGPADRDPPDPVDGRRARWADHRTARRAELIEATIAAVRLHGATVGMDQIAAAAQTSKPVIYRHFSDKADLYRAVGGRVADQLVVDVAAATADVTDPRERLARGIDAFFRVLELAPELYRFVVAYPVLDGPPGGRYPPRPRDEDRVADYLDRVQQLFTRLLLDRPGLDVPVAQARLWATCIVGLVRSAGDWWLLARGAGPAGSDLHTARPGAWLLTRAELTQQVTTLAWTGVTGAVTGPEGAARGR